MESMKQCVIKKIGLCIKKMCAENDAFKPVLDNLANCCLSKCVKDNQHFLSEYLRKSVDLLNYP